MTMETTRVIPWGTITAGSIALLTALALFAVQYGRVTIPLGVIGPGAIITVGVAVLAAGLFVVLRSNARERKAAAAVPASPASTTQTPAPAPLDATRTPILGARYDSLDEPADGPATAGQPEPGEQPRPSEQSASRPSEQP